jgi:hypothetical protein
MARRLATGAAEAAIHQDEDLRIEVMSAQLEQIRFQMEEARPDYATAQEGNQERARQETRRFYIQMVVTSIAGVTAAVALILHLLR